MAGNIVRRQGKLKLALTLAGTDLLAMKGDHTALKVLEQALFDNKLMTYSQLIHKLFVNERWPMTELRDIMSGISRHLPVVHQAGKIDPAAITEVFSVMSVPLPSGYSLKNEQRVMTTADYVCGAAVYLNGLYRTRRLGGRDVWNEVQKHSPSQAVTEALMLVVQPSMRDPGRSREVMPESLQRICQTYGLTLTGNCAVKLYDLLAEELAALRKAEQVLVLPKLKTSARVEAVEVVKPAPVTSVSATSLQETLKMIVTRPESAEEAVRRRLPGWIAEEEDRLKKIEMEEEKRTRNLAEVKAAIAAARARQTVLEESLALWREATEPIRQASVEKLSHLRALLK